MGWVVAASCGSLQKPDQIPWAGLVKGELVWRDSPKPLQRTWMCQAVVEVQVGATEETKDSANQYGLRKGKKLPGSVQIERRACGCSQVPQTFRSRNAVCHRCGTIVISAQP